ncbi:MAG: prepilin-type N-terminal cleavage/methylation domain-containing protein [Candidatus Saccharibacteria bacterium]
MIQKMRKANIRGFSLVELIVVIVIISILVLAGVVGFGKVQRDARDDKRNANATIIAEALEKYYNKNGEYPSTSAIADQPTDTVKSKLGIADTDVLIFPQATSTSTSAITSTTLDTTKVAYNGVSVNSSEVAQCENPVSSGGKLAGGCDQFALQWKNEDGTTGEIKSRQSGRSTELAAPNTPTVVASLTGGSVRGTVSGSTCAAGTIQYKIYISPTNSVPDWSTLSWQTGTTKDLASPTAGVNYFIFAIAHCVQGASGESNPSGVGSDDITVNAPGTPSMTATWNTTSAVATVTPDPAYPCTAGYTRKYFIQYKIDTTASAGSWTNAVNTTDSLNWTTSSTYTIANANTSNPRKFSFQAKVRCDNGATPGAETVYSNIDFVVSAPSSATVSNSSDASITTWTWSAVSCPVGTTVKYTGTWTGNYTDAGGVSLYPDPASFSFTSGMNIPSSTQGYTYGTIINTSCGTSSAKVLATASSDSTYHRVMAQTKFRTGKAVLLTYTPSGESSSTVYLRGVVTTTQVMSGSSSACPTGTTRVIGWATSAGGTWSPNPGPTTPEASWVKDERAWSGGGQTNFYYTADMNSGDTREAKFLTRCKNMVTGEYSGPASPASSSAVPQHTAGTRTYIYDDRYGNLYSASASGTYHVLCDISGSDGDSLKSPVWCTSGYDSSGSNTGDSCHMEDPYDNITGTMHSCWSDMTSKGVSAWGWSTGPPKDVNDPSNLPSTDQTYGLDASSTWGEDN